MYPLTVLIHVPSLLLLLLSGISLDYTILAHDFVHMDLDTYMKEERRYYRWDINTAARYRHTPSHASSHPTCQHTLSYIYECTFTRTSSDGQSKQSIWLLPCMRYQHIPSCYPSYTLSSHYSPTHLPTYPPCHQTGRASDRSGRCRACAGICSYGLTALSLRFR